MLRVLLDCSSASQETGGNVQLCLSMANIAAKDDSIDLIIVANPLLIPMLSSAANDKVVATCARPGSGLISYLRWLKTLLNKIKQYRPDFILVPYGPLYAIFSTPTLQGFAEPWLPKADGRYRAICSVYELFKSYARKKIQIFFYRTSELIWAETKSGVDYFCEISGYPKSRTSVFTNTLPAAISNAPIKESTWRSNEQRPFKLLYVAAPYKHKNHKIILDLLLMFPDLNIEFYITIPTNTSGGRNLISEIKKNKLTNKIFNYDFVKPSNLSEIYANCDAVFMPSVAEVFSATYLEGMHFNRPVIAADLPFAREVLGDAGVYFDPWSPESAAFHISACMSDGALYAESVRRGSLRVSSFDSPYDKYHKLKCAMKSYLKDRAIRP